MFAKRLVSYEGHPRISANWRESCKSQPNATRTFPSGGGGRHLGADAAGQSLQHGSAFSGPLPGIPQGPPRGSACQLKKIVPPPELVKKKPP